MPVALAADASPVPGQDVSWGELHVGNRSMFEAAGFSELVRPTIRRVVMRVDFA